jgi:hypothetical protein
VNNSANGSSVFRRIRKGCFQKPRAKEGRKLTTKFFMILVRLCARYPLRVFAANVLDYQLFGERVWGPSEQPGAALLEHVALFLVLRTLTGTLWRSFFVAALFGVHPLRVESVAWVAERKEVLSTFFFILSLWAYARYAKAEVKVRKQKSKVRMLLSSSALSGSRLVVVCDHAGAANRHHPGGLASHGRSLQLNSCWA